MSLDIVDLKSVTAPVKPDARETFALDVLMGLTSKPKSLPPRYFYDEEGSKIFAEITNLAEYYPTQCEFDVFRRHGRDIVRLIGSEEINLVELGAGDGRKTKVLLKAFGDEQKSLRYYPIDISESAVKGLMEALEKEFPSVPSKGVISEYYDGIRWLRGETKGRNVILFLGSNIGNFSRPQSRFFLRTLWNSLHDGDIVLIGFDLKKDIDVMLLAYNDPKGVTRRFNLNLLTRINRELGGNFDLAKYQHFGTYNVSLGCMESFLISLDRQEVKIDALAKAFSFNPWEAIHVEFSFKFLPQEIDDLAAETGFEVLEKFYDSRSYFCDAIFEVRKGSKGG